MGLWQGEDGVEPYGELLEIKVFSFSNTSVLCTCLVITFLQLCSGNMQGWLVRAPALDQLMGPVRYEHLFSLKISDDKQVPRVTCCYRAQKGTDVKITKASYMHVVLYNFWYPQILVYFVSSNVSV